MTIELTGSKKDQRDWITGRIGFLRIQWERLDEKTWNATLKSEDVDAFTDCLDEAKIEWRLV